MEKIYLVKSQMFSYNISLKKWGLEKESTLFAIKSLTEVKKTLKRFRTQETKYQNLYKMEFKRKPLFKNEYKFEEIDLY